MAMTLRLTDEETALLRRQTEREGRSMHEVVRLAIQERIAHQDHAGVSSARGGRSSSSSASGRPPS
jgi:hypothetical protein